MNLVGSSHSGIDTKIYQVALSMLPFVGGTLARQLINYCGSAEAVFTSPIRHLSRIPGIGEKIIGGIKNASSVLDQAEKEVFRCHQEGIEILAYTDEKFPGRLRHIYDAPILLYYKGKADLNHHRMLSIVGTRQATAYGKEVVEKLISELLPYQAIIVSGLAYGIDILAHRMALQVGLPTVGIMGSGMDIIYPAVHKRDAWQMLEEGGILTENPLGTKPDARKFPARNRIIAALTDATIVVEAAAKGGALITANFANEYDREVFAVPGSWNQTYSTGCNKLIKEHKAHILVQANDIVEMLNWDFTESPAKKKENKPVIQVAIDEQEQRVVDVLIQQTEAMIMDTISWHAQLSVSQLASVLLSLEFKGVIRALPGKKYQMVSS
ncbi:DNA-processing protein DprA [Catalinimonas niigatensis]|uniref:DNA-processing protein DprA n=1 Tax=Catalinimonas niigatensis TaxID=1397264 RepID=UPI002665BEB7|nr:DNA-processing protein DprA [Catalinimonas niigatensis]WPP53081.1 DNA-processing protein DprA [Catalinimonas niigatensis]